MTGSYLTHKIMTALSILDYNDRNYALKGKNISNYPDLITYSNWNLHIYCKKIKKRILDDVLTRANISSSSVFKISINF